MSPVKTTPKRGRDLAPDLRRVGPARQLVHLLNDAAVQVAHAASAEVGVAGHEERDRHGPGALTERRNDMGEDGAEGEARHRKGSHPLENRTLRPWAEITRPSWLGWAAPAPFGSVSS